MYRSMYKFLLLLLFTMFIVACNSDDGEVATAADSVDEEPVYVDDDYLPWEDNDNGEWVVDANGDEVRFLASAPHYMVFGETLYENVWVDTDGGDFWVDGSLMGAVTLVEADEGGTIAALVGNNDYFLDIVGSEDDLEIVESNLTPFSLISSQTGETTKELAAAKAIPSMNDGTMSIQSVPASQRLSPKLAPNAFPNPPTGERKTGYLRQPQQ